MAQPPSRAERHPVGPPELAMPLLVAAVIVHDRRAHRVLLLQRGPRARFGRGLWDLPVGKGERGEPVTRTAVRELWEETGLRVEPASLRVAHVVHAARGVEAPQGYLTVVFVTEEWTGDPVNREPEKHTQVCWVDVDAIPANSVPVMASALRQYLAGGPGITLHGW